MMIWLKLQNGFTTRLKNFKKLKIYLIADFRGNCSKFIKTVETLLSGGIDALQLRAKSVDKDTLYRLTESLKVLSDKYGAPFIINDYWELVKMFELSGVHVGREDFPPVVLREILQDKVIGYTVNSTDDIEEAERGKVNYIGVGAVFETKTKAKEKTKLIGIGGLKKIIDSVNINVYAIGGIDDRNVKLLKGLDIKGIAVSSYLMNGEDPLLNLKKLKKAIKN